MSEMKIGSTDPKVIATVIIVNHGKSLTLSEVGDYVFEAVGEGAWPDRGTQLMNDVWTLIQSATVHVAWSDDETLTSVACGGSCCGGQYEYSYGYEDDEIVDVH